VEQLNERRRGQDYHLHGIFNPGARRWLRNHFVAISLSRFVLSTSFMGITRSRSKWTLNACSSSSR